VFRAPGVYSTMNPSAKLVITSYLLKDLTLIMQNKISTQSVGVQHSHFGLKKWPPLLRDHKDGMNAPTLHRFRDSTSVRVVTTLDSSSNIRGEDGEEMNDRFHTFQTKSDRKCYRN